jgi:glycosyltransferase involved in cell wall biosynthesis
MPSHPHIALVHDELVRRGGAEIVLEELVRVFPQADVYALYSSNNPVLSVSKATYPIHTSFIQKLPIWFRQHPGRVLPLLPYAAEQLDLSDYELVISSTSGFAKGVVTRATIPHICYCHAPTRYLWDASLEVARRVGPSRRFVLKILQHYLRMADFTAAQRPNIFIANSQYTKQRLATYYRRASTVVYPPIDTQFFTPLRQARPSTEQNLAEQAPFFLCVGRLSATKYFDHAIAVCEKLQLPLVIIGTGQEAARLKAISGRHTKLS